MGAVGLSFGSPTSGTGFDVSSTVSQIVANLANVETPWKTQLSKLESQDTVISNLGSLLSSLSNDVSQLTDFTGIMAQKTGSSSDTNVLELTNATSAASAGTHTVVVKNLATTSSGYLTEVASASAKLSGSITLKSGNGTAQTINMSSLSSQTLSGLAQAINSSGVGVTASVLTDATGSRLSLVSGTSGANGAISITANSLAAAANTGMNYTAATSSSGTLTGIPSANDSLSGTIAIQVGTNAAQTLNVDAADGDNTLSTLMNKINNAGLGVTASIVTNGDGTESLSLSTGAGGAALSVTPSLTDTQTPLAYTQTVAGSNAALSVDGVNLSSASNTVTNLIPGLTFQLLAPSATESDGSLEQVQVVIGNDNSGVESAINQMVTDYNSLVSAVNTQEGNDSSGNPEPLFGSPTLGLLQQQLMNSLNLQNPNGYLTPITMNSSTTLTGQVTLQAGNGARDTFVMGAGTSSGNTIYTGSNSMQSLVDAINAAATNTPIPYTSTASDSGSFTANSEANLNGTFSIQTASGTTQTIYLGASADAPTGDLATGSSTNTLSDLETYINENSSTLGVTASIVANGDGTSTLSLSSTDASALTVTSSMDIPGIGVTAGITTSNGQSTLSLLSQMAGTAGALTVTSTISAASQEALTWAGMAASGSSNSQGVLAQIPSGSDLLSGSIAIQVGSAGAQTITIDSSDNTLQGLADAINNSAGLGVTATVTTNSDGSAYLTLESQTAGNAGNLTVTSNVLDTTNTTTTNMTYTDSSDVSTLANLGITVSQKDDGSLAFDASVLDSALNTDYAGVLGFFQSVNSWGQNFATMLEDAGTSSPTGVLSLAQSSNSSTESTLNAEISKEETTISTEQKSLTAELTSANEVMQELPSQLQGVNELYAAITGYNQNTNG